MRDVPGFAHSIEMHGRDFILYEVLALFLSASAIWRVSP